MKIGIGITEYNRYGVFSRSLVHMMANRPHGSKIVVVDDGSDEPVREADIRHSENLGIAAAKNSCLSLLDDCDHIFLFDSDCYPKTKDWWRPYVFSPYNHMCFSFEHNYQGNRLSHSVYVKQKHGDMWEYNAPNGCMLYLTRECLEKVGGMDVGYGKWSFEHVSYSMRIHNAGLTPYPFMDVPNSLNLIHSEDYYGSVCSSVPSNIRQHYAQINKHKYQQQIESKEYINYK